MLVRIELIPAQIIVIATLMVNVLMALVCAALDIQVNTVKKVSFVSIHLVEFSD